MIHNTLLIILISVLARIQWLGCAVEAFCVNRYQSAPTTDTRGRGTTTTLQQLKNDNYYGSVDSSYIVREFR